MEFLLLFTLHTQTHTWKLLYCIFAWKHFFKTDLIRLKYNQDPLNWNERRVATSILILCDWQVLF